MDISENPGEVKEFQDFGAMSADEQVGVIEEQFFPGEAEKAEESEESVEHDAKPEEEAQAEGADEDKAGKEDKEVKEGSEEAVVTEDVSEEPANSASLYTVTEFVTADPLSVDPERLPESARLVHQRYMEIYEREVAPKLAELEELKRVQQDTKEGVKDTFLEDVRAEVCRRLGVNELDGYDADHMATVNLVSREMADLRAEQAKVMRFADEIKSAPDFKRVDVWASEQLDKMPKANADVILKEIYSGDPVRIRAVYDAFAQKYREARQPLTSAAKTAPAKTEIVPPPKVIQGSNESSTEAPRWGYEDFAHASAKEQADMLVGMGLVEDMG